MLREPTLEKLYAMRLKTMAQTFETQDQDPRTHTMHFDERFGLMVEAEYLARENRRLARTLKEAKLRLPDACLEDLSLRPHRNIDEALIRKLATGGYIRNHLNVLISGATGCGKTYLACALGQKACREGLKVRYLRIPRLFEETALYRAEGTFAQYLQSLQRVQLLILDDFGLTATTTPQRQDLLEIMEDRYQSRSTIVASQLPLEQWHGVLGEPMVADAVLDRLVHRAYRLDLKGDSMRKETTEG